MINYCHRAPCGMNSAGFCSICGAGQQRPVAPFPSLPLQPPGCICPPTSEQTCKNPSCGRQPYRAQAVASIATFVPPEIGPEQIKHMVDRFLAWKLPADFSPDCGISFKQFSGEEGTPYRHKFEPVGTNLFTATQAEAMVRFMIEGMK